MAPGPRLQELTAKYMQNPRRYFVPLANEYRKANELDRAIALCREHLPAQPGHMSGHIVLARAYFEKGDIEAAREMFLTSVALDDENLIALRHLGDIARSRNELPDARQWYGRVLDADPQNDEIERIVRALGQPEAAIIDDTPVPPKTIEAPTIAAAIALEEPALEASAPAASALEDPTPPGLRAITTPGDRLGTGNSASSPVLPPVPARTLDTFDLSTLDDGVMPATGVAADEIRVDDGVGFMFDELDELTDPASAGAGLSLPPVGEGDFSAGIETPTTSKTPVPVESADPLLSRPGFGALASFASWRTAQDRDTPSQQPTQRATPTNPPDKVGPPAVASVADDGALFWDSASSDTASTAPEFVTETMAALYAQQGFTQQALDVYRALHARSPSDAGLAARVLELEMILASGGVDKALQDDADKALQFDELDGDDDAQGERRSALEGLYDISPPSAGAAPFGAGWSVENDAAAGVIDDWFADDAGREAPSDGGGFDGIFGIPTDGFGQTAIPSSARERVPTGSYASHAVTPLDTVFGGAIVAAADESAADMLLALAGQMVGRLPKDAPTLPVPDILELPSAVPGDSVTGASPAPLLSFDRFFSGSGSPPRQRIDTPAARGTPPARPSAQPAPTPPSLSPTFGGVPVIPPPPASVTPSSWATFDQFVPPAAVPPTASPTPAPTPKPLMRPVPVKPAALPPVQSAAFPTFTGLPSELTMPAPAIDPPKTARSAPPPADSDAQAAAESDDAGSAPSEFHRWLEGLT